MSLVEIAWRVLLCVGVQNIELALVEYHAVLLGRCQRATSDVQVALLPNYRGNSFNPIKLLLKIKTS
jgi:hypothetical protein